MNSTRGRRLTLMGLVLALVGAVLPTATQAEIYGFRAITSNSLIDPGIGESQLTVEVTGYGSNQVLFTFRNEGSQDCSIARVYFDDGRLLEMAEILDAPPDVDFETGAKPPNLPAGANEDFGATIANGATSPPAWHGVNPGESLGIVTNILNNPSSGYDFDHNNTVNFSDVLAALDAGLRDPVPDISLRIGLHVIAFADGQSEAFINGEKVPVPGAVVLGMLGMGAAGWRLRRFA